ncbi:MAG: hypothetical protein RLZZ253_3043, partial [Verrucomicrobiota bacterium]
MKLQKFAFLLGVPFMLGAAENAPKPSS